MTSVSSTPASSLSKGFELGPELRSQLCHVLAVWLWGSHLTFLKLSFLIGKYQFYMGLLGIPNKTEYAKAFYRL